MTHGHGLLWLTLRNLFPRGDTLNAGRPDSRVVAYPLSVTQGKRLFSRGAVPSVRRPGRTCHE